MFKNYIEHAIRFHSYLRRGHWDKMDAILAENVKYVRNTPRSEKWGPLLFQAQGREEVKKRLKLVYNHEMGGSDAIYKMRVGPTMLVAPQEADQKWRITRTEFIYDCEELKRPVTVLHTIRYDVDDENRPIVSIEGEDINQDAVWMTEEEAAAKWAEEEEAKKKWLADLAEYYFMKVDTDRDALLGPDGIGLGKEVQRIYPVNERFGKVKLEEGSQLRQIVMDKGQRILHKWDRQKYLIDTLYA
ncbi:hypothetical protein QOT17_010216 [Balamuthia mandrillaris]